MRHANPSYPAAGRSGRLSLLRAAFLCTAVLSGFARAQPATEPLLTRSTVVRPNLLLVLDTSGSMDGSRVYARHFVAATGTCPSDLMDPVNESPINNLLHYDPAKRYMPRVDANGNPMPNGVWNSTETGFSTFNIHLPKPGVNLPSLTTKEALCDANNYNEVKIKMTDTSAAKVNDVNVAGNPLQGSSNRTDCAIPTACTLAEERQNITNWAVYHRRRMAAAKTGVSQAFVNQPDTFRLGYTTIYVDKADGSGSGDLKLWGVKDYDLAKPDFFSWLQGLTPTSATPLRKAMDVAGQYYSRSDKNGPWAHSPWLSNSQGETAAEHLSCRRNFTILVTDGEWNGSQAPTVAARANIDGTDGPLITHSDGVTKYQYKAADQGDARNRGKADKVSTGNSAPFSEFPNTLADAAMYYWVNDLRPDLSNNVTAGKQTDKPFWQNMTVYTAAFGPIGKLTPAQVAQAKEGQVNWTNVAPAADMAETIDDLIHAAHNTGGEFLTLTDAESFATELGRVVGSIAGSEQFSQAGVAASAVALTTGTRKFVPYYTSNQWWGNVKMINLTPAGDENGVAWEVVETDNLGKPTGNAKIGAPASRKIYTWTPATKGIPFTWSALAPGFVASGPSSNTATLLHHTVNAAVVDYLRGDRGLEGETKAYRKREAILGDIVNSTPAFIKNNSNFGYERLPAATPGFSSYGAYMTAKGARSEGVLFIGANDGMVHAFREGTAAGVGGGSEIFAFIPQGVYGNLHELASKAYKHRYYVDGPMTESDAYINAPDLAGSGSVLRWTNLVLGSAGAGGRTVFALDVTQPLAMNEKSVLWEANYRSAGMDDLGYVMTAIESGITASGDWVAILGNGPYGASGRAHLFVLNLSTGQLLKKIDTNADTANGLGGVRVVRNANGMIVGAYAGDLKGNVWRFDLSAGSKAAWPSSGQLLFSAKDPGGQPQPITAAPGVVPRADLGGYMVIVGSGKLYDNDDHLSIQQQAAYGLWDKATFGGTATFSAIAGTATLIPISTVLEKVGTSTTNLDGATSYYRTTASRTVDWAVDRGWVISYDLMKGQRTIFSIEPTKQVVRVDTIAPRLSQVACAAGTSPGINYLVQPLTGTCRNDATFDLNNDGDFTLAKDSNACIYTTEADGEDVVLDIQNGDGTSSNFVDIQDSRGHVKAKVSDGCTSNCGPGPTGERVRRSWRQLFMRQK